MMMTGAVPGIDDTPNQHGMFILGDDTLFLCHMPMFTMEDHAYQVVLEAELDPTSAAVLVASMAAHPDQPHNLINLSSDQFTLPSIAVGDVRSYSAQVFANYSDEGSGSPVDPIVDVATVTVTRVVYFRHFNAVMPRPTELSYVLFGAGDRAHLSHYISTDPDFQHLLTIAAPPWLDATELRCGVTVSFPDLDPATPCTDPIAPGPHRVRYEGRAGAIEEVTVADGATVWFSTGNLLNATDPCAAG